jgi:hypothetical protein
MVWPCYVTLHGEQGGAGGSPGTPDTKTLLLSSSSSSSYFPIVDEITLLLERTFGGTDGRMDGGGRELGHASKKQNPLLLSICLLERRAVHFFLHGKSIDRTALTKAVHKN